MNADNRFLGVHSSSYYGVQWFHHSKLFVCHAVWRISAFRGGRGCHCPGGCQAMIRWWAVVSSTSEFRHGGCGRVTRMNHLFMPRFNWRVKCWFVSIFLRQIIMILLSWSLCLFSLVGWYPHSWQFWPWSYFQYFYSKMPFFWFFGICFCGC